MPKNTAKRNPFFYFMLDWKKRAEATGMKFPNGLRDVQANQECSREWQKMTDEQKQHYVSLSKDQRIKDQVSGGKKTTFGESLQKLEDNKRQEEEFRETMNQYIRSLVSVGYMHNNLDKLKFILIHVNWFFIRTVDLNKYEYFPAEFAVAEFSLENGIGTVYHEILGIDIPLGYRRDAMENSQATHKIPVEFSDGRKDFSELYTELLAFLQTKIIGSKLPPLFTSASTTLAVDSLLNMMTSAAGADRDSFSVYSVEKLFEELRNAAARKANFEEIPLVVAKTELEKDTFAFVRGLECEFHKNIDGTTQYCSMSIIKRWAFTICDYCCEHLGIDIIRGIHRPHDYWVNDSLDDTYANANSTAAIVDQLSSMLSMTGVSEKHRIEVSERTAKEEERRRQILEPLDIVHHGSQTVHESVSTSLPPQFQGERPLRTPKTRSYAMVGTRQGMKTSLTDDEEFPPIGGRGYSIKKKVNTIKHSIGRGRGSA